MQPLLAMTEQLRILQDSGEDSLDAYLRNVRLELYKKAQHAVLEVEK